MSNEPDLAFDIDALFVEMADNLGLDLSQEREWAFTFQAADASGLERLRARLPEEFVTDLRPEKPARGPGGGISEQPSLTAIRRGVLTADQIKAIAARMSDLAQEEQVVYRGVRCGESPGQEELAEEDADAAAEGGEMPGSLTWRAIAELACKILAVWIFAQAALTLAPLILYALVVLFREHAGEAVSVLAASAAVPLGALIVGGFLWMNSRSIARRMVRKDGTIALNTTFDAEQWMTLAFTVVGIYALWASAEGVFRRLAQVVYLSQLQGFDNASFWGDVHWKAGFWGMVGSLAFAIWLLLGSRGIVRFVQRLRRSEPAAEDDGAERTA